MIGFKNGRENLSKKQHIDAVLLSRARRMAKRNRAEQACRPCKEKKAKCSDFRPCSRCMKTNPDACLHPHSDDHPSANVQVEKCIFDPRIPCIPTISYDWDRSANYVVGIPHIPSRLEFVDSEKECLHDLHGIISPSNVKTPTSCNRYVTTFSQSDHSEQMSRIWFQMTDRDYNQQQSNHDKLYEQAWTWEAAAGPGTEDPFKDDWAGAISYDSSLRRAIGGHGEALEYDA